MSPIKPENRHKYPGGSPTSKEWKALRASIQERAGNYCEWCGVPNREMVIRRGEYWCKESSPPAFSSEFWEDGDIPTRTVKIVCTVAHLDHDPRNNKPENLAFLCQRCHNQYDAKHRAETRKKGKGK